MAELDSKSVDKANESATDKDDKNSLTDNKPPESEKKEGKENDNKVTKNLPGIDDAENVDEDDDKAVHFIQAEKLYYESALIDTSDLHHRLEEQKNGNEGQETNIDIIRAEEYEHLARLCLDKKQPQLALEYAGKTAKLRQKVYGEDHPITLKTLDFFATIYAEVGAEQYQDSMNKYSSSHLTDDDSSESPEDVPEFYSDNQSTEEPVSILRKRKSSEKEKHVRFDETQIQDQQQAEREEKFAKKVLWGLFIVCTILLTILGVYLYCHLTNSTSCTNLKSDIHYALMRLKYYYYHFSSTSREKYT
ncbi:hypothetical protein KUTeg_014342 [Tegillarca granosa]|uniref:Consortin N-terminal domain-containing protein n=1 Tax=Tegillarca granosa TaxID=220873 RepID=A0ABQ9EWE4_TEGGR|nr:hypothetical protein KUTeg_014342 [Tegillarca granosa]